MLTYEQLPPGLKQIHMKMPPGPEARGYEVNEAAELGGWRIGKKGLWVRRRGEGEYGVIQFITSATWAG
jgi:hypothetical protein